jgi:hypothetical protein
MGNTYQGGQPGRVVKANGAIPRYRILRPMDAATGSCQLANATPANYSPRVSQHEAVDGQTLQVAVAGDYTMVEAGGALTDGVCIAADASGKAVAAANGAKAIGCYVAKPGDGTVADGDIVNAFLYTVSADA